MTKTARAILIAGIAAGLSLPTSAYAGSETVLDKQLDVIPGWEISDIIAATVTYGTSRITIEVEHSEWIQNWKRQPAATGGRLTFSNGRTYVITPGASGRKSVLATLKQFRHCVAQPKGGPWGEPCRTLKCSGWTYAIDKANLSHRGQRAGPVLPERVRQGQSAAHPHDHRLFR